ncbi:hypothetical protein Vadar_028108 [Vaccinium darrowii]|uniref:Uncharacterized protein n=1 Tax=Vaccinium darrowii TaxID=229202 RepID=A0ACB7X4V5_9ERIC|nr:hypothetical protein Vadar_028108 [Vaccinium darrowii]
MAPSLNNSQFSYYPVKKLSNPKLYRLTLPFKSRTPAKAIPITTPVRKTLQEFQLFSSKSDDGYLYCAGLGVHSLIDKKFEDLKPIVGFAIDDCSKSLQILKHLVMLPCGAVLMSGNGFRVAMESGFNRKRKRKTECQVNHDMGQIIPFAIEAGLHRHSKPISTHQNCSTWQHHQMLQNLEAFAAVVNCEPDNRFQILKFLIDETVNSETRTVQIPII